MCTGCRAPIMVEAFPALLQSQTEPNAGDRLLTDEEAGCFYHSDKRASIICDNCGRFLCALCDVQIGGRHLCPSCIALSHTQQSETSVELDRYRVHYDSLALTLACLPLIFTQLITFYLVIRHWSTPVSALPRGRVRWILAVVIAVGWIGCLGGLFYSWWS